MRTHADLLMRNLAAIDEQIAEKRQSHPGWSYGALWKVVASERPDLIKSYNESAGAAEGGETVTLADIDRLDGQINDSIHARMRAAGLTYRDALIAEARERPALFRARDLLLSGRSKSETVSESPKRSPSTELLVGLVNEKVRSTRLPRDEAAKLVCREMPEVWRLYCLNETAPYGRLLVGLVSEKARAVGLPTHEALGQVAREIPELWRMYCLEVGIK